MEEIVSLNGKLVPRREARVSVDDQGFLYGYALFETMRAYHGRVFLLERHLERLITSARVIHMASQIAGINFAGACDAVMEANQLKEARLRLTVSRGEAVGFPGSIADTAPTVLLTARAYTPMPQEIYEKGYTALVSSFPRCAHSPLSRLKSANYLASILAKMEADAAGAQEALLLNERGKIAEGSVSNVFFVKEGVLLTPLVTSGILPGITREVVLELAQNAGIEVAEREITPEELNQFDEAFLTNSVMEIMPLVGVRDKSRLITIGRGKPGEITRKLMPDYQEMVRRETGYSTS